MCLGRLVNVGSKWDSRWPLMSITWIMNFASIVVFDRDFF